MITALFFFIFGVTIGSFLNVLVFRTHEEWSLVGHSKCMKCEMPLKWYDMVPVLSYVVLRGRCRNCKTAISWQYPVVEFITGLLFILMYLRYAEGLFLPDYASPDNLWLFFWRDLLFSVFLIILFVYDLRYVLILDRFTLPAMIIAVLLNLWLGMDFASILLGGLVIGLFFAAQFVVSEGKWVGGGDVRMGVLMGFMLGIRDGLVALFIAYAIGAVVGILLVMSEKASPKSKVPFGTFLAIATFVILLAGERIVQWYVGLFA